MRHHRILLSFLLVAACSGGRDRGAPSAACGNGYLESGEQCDDRNRVSNDGCDAACRVEPAVCGDGVLQSGEGCEDANTIAGDGCDAACVSEVAPMCGDRIWQAGEQCDDGNAIDGDGCSAACIDERRAACGDRRLQEGEECDDGNVVDGDGCSAACRSERAPACGDGILQTGEVCDDGNTTPGDGCSASCSEEIGCNLGCPFGFTCDLSGGFCAGGQPTGIAIDVRVFTISGGVLHNGAAPATEFPETNCGTIRFEDVERGLAFSGDLDCTRVGDAFSYTVDVYPGTYEVTVSGSSFTSLPTTRYRALATLPVQQSMQDLLLDVVTYSVDGYVTHNGAPPSTEFPEESCGTVRFEEKVKGYAISTDLDCSTAGPFRYSVELYPGEYDVYVSGQTFTSLPTVRFHARAGLTVAGGMRDLIFDVPTVPADGLVLQRGVPPTAEFFETNCGTVRFEELLEGYAFSVDIDCSTGSFVFDAVVFPGTYRISASGQSFTSLPTTRYEGLPSQPIRGPTTGLIIDVITHQASGTVLHNGAVPGTEFNETSCGTVRFEELDRGTTFTTDLDCSGPQFTYAATVFPGTYRISVTGASFTTLPSARYEGFASQAIRGDVTGLAIDVLTFAVDGQVLLNGTAPGTEFFETDCGNVRFEDAERGYVFTNPVDCSTGQFRFAHEVYPGRYAVSASGQSFTTLPTVRWVQFTDLPVTGALTGITIDVPTRTTSGLVTRDGAAPTSEFPETNCGTARYEEITHGYAFSTDLDCTRPNTAFTFTQQVFPGTYIVSVSGQSFTNIPTTRYRPYDPIRID